MEMRKLFAVLAMVLFLFATVSIAQEKDIDLTIKGTYSIYQDRDLVKDGVGLKGELRWKYFYLWGSWENAELRLTGQRAGGIDLYGVGLGGKVVIWKPLSAFIEFGYYIPDSELADDPNKYAEGVYYKWYKTLKEIGLPQYAHCFTNYKYELKSGLGGSLGLELKQRLYKGLYVNGFGSYRFLNLREDWDAYSPRNPASYIQTKEKRDFSGAVFGAGLSYKF